MPYKSAAQRRKFRAMLKRGELPRAVVEEFDKASKSRKLPERVHPRKGRPRPKG